jgi:ribonuclease P protein component
VRRLRLDKRIIIKSSRDFDSIFRWGKRASSEHLLILFREAKQTRFGFTVSKEIKGAVKRNRAKRRLKEIVRLSQDKMPSKREYVFLAKAGVESSHFASLENEFLELLKRINQRRSS